MREDSTERDETSAAKPARRRPSPTKIQPDETGATKTQRDETREETATDLRYDG
jgi:hypothetical protein